MTDGCDFRVLGPMVAERDGAVVDLGGPQHRMVLAVLLCRAGRTVPVEQLVEVLWNDAPPRSYRTQLQCVVSDLRLRLAPGGHRPAAPIVTRGGGYAVRVPPDRLDLDRFRSLVERGRQAGIAGDNATAVRLLGAALAEWRGPAFADVPAPAMKPVAPRCTRCGSPRSRTTCRPGSTTADWPGWPTNCWRWRPSTRCGSGCTASS
jgi:DNA-binding SARP family transcriptional activator